MALAFLAGATAIALVARQRLNTAAPVPQAKGPEPAASLGPLPLTLSEESLRPARLSGQIESAGAGVSGNTDSSTEAGTAAANVPSCDPPPLGDDPWRPSTRVASYQAEVSDRDSPRQTQSASTVNEPAPGQTFQSDVSRQAGQPDLHKPVALISHRIVDGDTLSGLAQRYLGSSKRFTEIFDANRDQLQSPDLLPIGVVLRIPRHEVPEASASP
jgi:nucleoid-associated protein YgaU